jgi:hypothetical protein
MVMKARPSCSPMPQMVPMQGWMAVASGFFGEEFEGDKAVEAGVFGFVEHTHAAVTELFKNSVVRDDLTDERLGSVIVLARSSLSRCS